MKSFLFAAFTAGILFLIASRAEAQIAIRENAQTTNTSSFGNLDLGDSLTKIFELINSGTSPISITSGPSLSGTNASDFSVLLHRSPSLATSASTTILIRDGGDLKCFGRNSANECRMASDDADNFSPIATPRDPLVSETPSSATWEVALGQAIAVGSGSEHLCAVHVVPSSSPPETRVSCSGEPSHGRLGNGSTVVGDPSYVVDSSDNELVNIVSLGVGSAHTCAISHTTVSSVTDTYTYCWGLQTVGQLGNSAIVSSQSKGVLVSTGGTPERGFTKVDAGENFTCALRDGQAYCWGGLRTDSDGSVLTSSDNNPTLVRLSDGTVLTGISDLSLGRAHACFIANGGAYCFGRNNEGQLGQGNVVAGNSKLAVMTGLSSGVTMISAGDRHTCLLHNGALKCVGQIPPATTSTGTPVSITSFASGVTAIAAGLKHTCVVVGSQLRCWGKNDENDLGVLNSADDMMSGVDEAASSASVIPTNTADIQLPTLIPPKSSHFFSLRFAPTSEGSLTASASLTAGGSSTSLNLSGGRFVLPAIVTQPNATSVNQSDAVSFSVTASGTATLSYQWRKDGSNISGATSSSLTISNVQTTDAGEYMVVVTNTAGSVTSSAATLSVSAKPVVTSVQILPSGATQAFEIPVTVKAVDGETLRASGSLSFSSAEYRIGEGEWVEILERDFTLVSSNQILFSDDPSDAPTNLFFFNTLPYFTGRQENFQLRIALVDSSGLISDAQVSELETVLENNSTTSSPGALIGCSLQAQRAHSLFSLGSLFAVGLSLWLALAFRKKRATIFVRSSKWHQ